GLGREGQVPLALDGQGVALARLLVELDVAGLAVLGERVGLGLEGLGLAEVVGALALELLQLALQELVEHRRLLLGAGGGLARCCLLGGGLGGGVLGGSWRQISASWGGGERG